jgi:hypothetical protein
MSMNTSPYRNDPSLPGRCLGTLAVSVAAALAAGALMLLQSGCTGEQMELAHSDTSASAHGETIAAPRSAARAASAPAAALDAGVDWSRAEPAPDRAGESVAAYDR